MTKVLTSYYTKSRWFSADLLGFGPVRVSQGENPNWTKFAVNKKSLESSNLEKLQDVFNSFLYFGFCIVKNR